MEVRTVGNDRDELSALFADKDEIRRIVEEQNRLMGHVHDPAATAEEAQALVAADLRRHGIRPEDNIFSCGIIAARDEE